MPFLVVHPTCPMGSCVARCSRLCDSASDAQVMHCCMLLLPSVWLHISRPATDGRWCHVAGAAGQVPWLKDTMIV